MSCRMAAVVAAGLLLISPLRASAQGTATSFEQLRVLVRSGDTITVREAGGVETTGKVESLSSTSLLLNAAGTRRELREPDVTEILQRRQDSLGNGALLGLVIGAATGGTFLAVVCSREDEDCGGAREVLAFVGVYAGIGTGIGVGFDALIVGRQVVYQKQVGRVSLGVTPLLTRGRTGAAVSVGF